MESSFRDIVLTTSSGAGPNILKIHINLCLIINGVEFDLTGIILIYLFGNRSKNQSNERREVKTNYMLFLESFRPMF